MPITKSAKKALRQSIRRRALNLRQLQAARQVIKKLRGLIAAKKRAEAEALFPQVQKAFDKLAKRGIIKKNTAARKKSRLSVMVRKIS
ncbi:30S ribosomal protein S20 [Patescibacteria group bacterium]|nr:MAG: 30S ribosomal protein S20 [Patescibacteria group bacterium]